MNKGIEQRAELTPCAKAFYAMLKLAETNEEVREQLERMAQDTTREELIAYGKEKGFIFDEQDLEAVSKDILEPTDELNEEELEKVAGGTTADAVTAGYMTSAFAALQSIRNKYKKLTEGE